MLVRDAIEISKRSRFMMVSGGTWTPLLLIPVFCIATGLMYGVMTSAPVIEQTEDNQQRTFMFPTNIDDIKSMADLLRHYNAEHHIYVLMLFCSSYLYKQAFAIPGSALLNILGGALFGVKYGLALCAVLTAIGATISYTLSRIFLKQLITSFIPSQVAQLKQKIDSNKTDNLLYFLLSIRLFPASPNWLINITSPIVGVPIQLFFVTAFLGLLPYNYLCVQSGAMLATITSLDDVFTSTTLIQLMALAFGVLIPKIVMKKLYLASGVDESANSS